MCGVRGTAHKYTNSLDAKGHMKKLGRKIGHTHTGEHPTQGSAGVDACRRLFVVACLPQFSCSNVSRHGNLSLIKLSFRSHTRGVDDAIGGIETTLHAKSCGRVRCARETAVRSVTSNMDCSQRNRLHFYLLNATASQLPLTNTNTSTHVT